MNISLDTMQIYNLVNAGRGKCLGTIGVQGRSVYQIDGRIYEKAINFDDGQDHNHYYQVSLERAEELIRFFAEK